MRWEPWDAHASVESESLTHGSHHLCRGWTLRVGLMHDTSLVAPKGVQKKPPGEN